MVPSSNPCGNVNSLMEDGYPYKLNGLQNITLMGIVTIDKQTHTALSIFQDDRHPSFQGIGVKKEGLSVFGILSKSCASAPGR